jgi:uncharacterized protein
MTPEDVAVGIVALNGGKLVGRTRLQKAAFLLEQAGMNAGLEFFYYHFGPFSAELARGCDEAELDDRLKMEESPGSREMPYTVFTTIESPPSWLGKLSEEHVRELLARMQEYSDVVVELAATIVYLRRPGVDPIEEVKVRKPLKATPKRLELAQMLIGELGLAI